MAQTKRKRRSKHRGTPAGTIEARGRTGRKPTGSEVKSRSREDARRARMLQRPTWKNALFRAVTAALLLFVLMQLFVKASLGQSLGMALFAVALYIPLGYYTDQFMWRRRVNREARKRETAGTR